MAVTVLTWNLKGAKGVDVGRVVDHIAAAAADVVVLKEVRRGQARPIARGLGGASHRWAFKHWPIRTWPEGMAVIGVTEPAPARTHALTRRWAPWSWRRRVAQVASVALAGMRDGVTLVNVHLSAGDAASRLAADDLQPVAAALRHAGDPDFAHFAAISDHLPLAVTLETVAPDD